MKKVSPIVALAHPNSLRLTPGRPCFVTEEGISRRIDEGRGLGERHDYTPWLYCTDFSSSGYRRMVYSPKLGRIVHLLSELEFNAFLVAEFTDIVIDIRENYPLDRGRTREIAKRLKIDHPAPYGVDIVMTTDLFITVATASGPRYMAWYVKYESASQDPRAQELFAIEREYHEGGSPSVPLMKVTEHSFPRVLIQNLKYVRGALRPMGWLNRKLAHQLDRSLRPLAHRFALADICEEADRRFRLRDGAALRAVRHFIATHTWKVNMFKPINPHSPITWEVQS